MSTVADLEELEHVVRRGKALQRILDEPAFQEVLKDTRENLIGEWERAKTVPEREAAHATLKGLSKLSERINALIETGKHTSMEMTRVKRNPA